MHTQPRLKAHATVEHLSNFDEDEVGQQPQQPRQPRNDANELMTQRGGQKVKGLR